jgi:hypothetical protein
VVPRDEVADAVELGLELRSISLQRLEGVELGA